MTYCNAPNRVCTTRDGNLCPQGKCWYDYPRLRATELREFREREIAKLLGGDLVFFGGADASDLVHLITDVVSNGIAVLTRSNLTHVAMVLEPSFEVGLAPQVCLNLIESTILNGVSGPQINPAAERIETYPGLVFLAKLRDRTRAMLDWPGLWIYMLNLVGPGHYSIKSLVDDLARMVPIVGKLPAFYRSETNAADCSEYIAEGFRAGGFPGLNPHVDCPQTIAEWHIFEDLIQVAGTPATIRNFNSK